MYVSMCFVCISEGMLLLLTSQKKKLRKIFLLAFFLMREGKGGEVRGVMQSVIRTWRLDTHT